MQGRFLLTQKKKARTPQVSYWVFSVLRYLIAGGFYAAHPWIDETFRMGILG